MQFTKSIAAGLAAGFLATGCSGKVAELESQVAQYETDQAALMAKIEEMKADANRPSAFVETRVKAYRNMAKKLRTAFGDEADAQVMMQDGQLVVHLASDVLFASGSAELQDGGQGTLDSVATVLQEIGSERRFLVAGHTDDEALGSRSKFASNWDLSTQRALSAVNYLVEQGVDPTQLGAVGYGEHRPVAANDTDEGKAANRRVELVFVPTPSERAEVAMDLDQAE